MLYFVSNNYVDCKWVYPQKKKKKTNEKIEKQIHVVN